MAHTDIHRPDWVLYKDPSMRKHFREVHHHPAGACDLNVFMAAWRHGNWVRTRCRIQWSSHQRICSCELCSQRAERRRELRRDRHHTRHDLRRTSGEE